MNFADDVQNLAHEGAFAMLEKAQAKDPMGKLSMVVLVF
jgi:hypothetical protein